MEETPVTATVRPAAGVSPAGGDVLTARGRVIRVRSAVADDAAALLSLHQRASAHSRYLRFFSAGADLHGEVRRLTRTPGGGHVALLAEDAGMVVGVASYERIDAGHADFAVLVDDARQGEGIGTLLLE